VYVLGDGVILYEFETDVPDRVIMKAHSTKFAVFLCMLFRGESVYFIFCWAVTC
jgi:UDP-2,3-diacylglucosamine pyrophosphatase LpxH